MTDLTDLIYTQPGILRDEVPEERQRGIDAGLAWRRDQIKEVNNE